MLDAETKGMLAGRAPLNGNVLLVPLLRSTTVRHLHRRAPSTLAISAFSRHFVTLAWPAIMMVLFQL